MDINKVKKETCDHIVALLEQNYQIKIEEKDKMHVMFLLNKMHGASYQSGMQEGINVKNQFDNFKQNENQ